MICLRHYYVIYYEINVNTIIIILKFAFTVWNSVPILLSYANNYSLEYPSNLYYNKRGVAQPG